MMIKFDEIPVPKSRVEFKERAYATLAGMQIHGQVTDWDPAKDITLYITAITGDGHVCKKDTLYGWDEIRWLHGKLGELLEEYGKKGA